MRPPLYSVQQIKFECLAYIKEFGAQPAQWRVAATRQPDLGPAWKDVDMTNDIWMCKPAASPIAVRTVMRFLIDRMGVQPAGDTAADGNCVLLYLKRGK